MTSPAIRIALLVTIALISARPTTAQTGVYVGATGVAEIKQFGTSTNISVLSLSDGLSLDSTGAGGGVRVGTFLHPRWSLELSADFGSETDVEYENPFVIPILTPQSRTLTASTSYLTVSTLIGFHSNTLGRVRLGYRAGFSFVRGTYKLDAPNLIFPAAVFAAESGPGNLRAVSLPLPSLLTPLSATRTHNAGALTLGFDAGIDLTRKLALVPEIRALVFSAPNDGPTVFLIRPGIGMRWNF
jgi:hypothetical protein